MAKKLGISSEDIAPHNSISAIIENNKGEILLMGHLKHNMWTIPVGKVQPDETVEGGLLTELGEELNIVPKKYKQILTYDKVYEYKPGVKTPIKMHVFKIDKYRGTIKNNEPKKHDKLIYKSPEAIRSFCKLTNRKIGDAVDKYLESIGL